MQTTSQTPSTWMNYLITFSCVNALLPGRRKCRGVCSGRLMKLKAWLAFFPTAVWSSDIPGDYRDCFGRYALLCTLSPVGIGWWPLSDNGRISPCCALNAFVSGAQAECPLLTSGCWAGQPGTATSTRCTLVNVRFVVNKTFILQDFFTPHTMPLLGMPCSLTVFTVSSLVEVGRSIQWSILLILTQVLIWNNIRLTRSVRCILSRMH